VIATAVAAEGGGGGGGGEEEEEILTAQVLSLLAFLVQKYKY
jgi:hypothetical protein